MCFPIGFQPLVPFVAPSLRIACVYRCCLPFSPASPPCLISSLAYVQPRMAVKTLLRGNLRRPSCCTPSLFSLSFYSPLSVAFSTGSHLRASCRHPPLSLPLPPVSIALPSSPSESRARLKTKDKGLSVSVPWVT
jgi:hypothetical protein